MTTRNARRRTRAAVDLAFDQDIRISQKEEDMANETAQIDELIEEVDRELAAEASVAGSARLRPFTDVDRARRSQRRAVREALQALQVRPVELGGEAA